MNDRNDGIDALISDHANHTWIHMAGGINERPLSIAPIVCESRRRCSAEKATTLRRVRNGNRSSLDVYSRKSECERSHNKQLWARAYHDA
jgi:hypothetical protein